MEQVTWFFVGFFSGWSPEKDENNHLPISGKKPWLHWEPALPFWHVLLTKVFSENENRVLQGASLQVSTSFINHQSVARGNKKGNEMCENIHTQVFGLLFSPRLLPVKHQPAITGKAVKSDLPRNFKLPAVLVFIKAPRSIDLAKQTGSNSASAPSSLFALLSFVGKSWNQKRSFET